MSYLNSATSNPIATLSLDTFPHPDFKMLMLDPDGQDLSADSSIKANILKPRDWSFIAERLWGPDVINTGQYYTIIGDPDSSEYELWVDAPPDTAGTNSIRVLHYGIPAWTETDSIEPFTPSRFDQLLINLTAINLRTDKDMDADDLWALTAPMYRELESYNWKPDVESDFSIPVQGRISGRRAFSNLRTGYVRRGN